MNENCLKDYCCPECKNEGPFTIGIKGFVEVEDDGFDHGEITDVRWNDDAYCECSKCSNSGIVADFTNSRTAGQGHKNICPGCGSDDTSRLELVMGEAGVMPDGKGGWDYDGNGTEVCWDSQTFTGIWSCDSCCHQWGRFDKGVIDSLLGKWAPEDPRNLNEEVFLHCLSAKSTHPIEAVVSWHTLLKGSKNMPPNKDLCRLLRAMHVGWHGREPKAARTVINWFNDHYPPGNTDRGRFEYLLEDLEAYLKGGE